jgi:hypothetical protein
MMIASEYPSISSLEKVFFLKKKKGKKGKEKKNQSQVISIARASHCYWHKNYLLTMSF